MAKVDILLPYWGNVELLKKAIESVLAQTEDDWRLLVFDDCYPSPEPAKYFESIKDKRVIYNRHPKNLGITKNFNFALGQAMADYCVMFGCDDIMLPNYIETALAKIGDADFYQPQVDVIDANGTVYLPLGDRIKKFLRPKKSGTHKGEGLAISLCRGNWLYFPSIMWRTETIKKYGFDDQYKIVEDVVLELDIIKDGGRLHLDNTTTFQYRRSSGSLSSVEKSKDGIRFSEEKGVYNQFSKTFRRMGWRRASFAASARITSRVNQWIS